MTTYFVSRHPGAIAWVKEKNYPVDVFLEHLDVSVIRSGDKVIGNVPMALAAEICDRGARYYSVSIQTSRGQRGKELTSEDMEKASCIIEEYVVKKVVS